MHRVVLLPGIMGSRLALDAEEVWPPTIVEAMFGYGRLAELQQPSLRATDVIRAVSCYSVYDSLINRLHEWGFVEAPDSGARGQLVVWPYDWRLDIRTTAAAFSLAMRELADADPQGTLSLVAHSMGGLVARYALEVSDPALGNTGWRSRVNLLVTMGTPHLGAPLALVRALGLDTALGVSAADFKSFTADSRYPSGYQLLPPTSARTCWNLFDASSPLEAVDVFDRQVASNLGLNLDNLAAASDFHAALASSERPAACRYFSFIGRQVKTIVRTELTSPVMVAAVKDADAGDGTVPIWSGTLPGEQFQLDGDEHGTTFRNERLLETLSQLLGVPAFIASAAAAAAPMSKCVLPSPVLDPDVPIIVKVQLPAPVAGELTVHLYAVDESGAVKGAPIAEAKASVAAGADVLPSLAITTPAAPGMFAVVAEFVGVDGVGTLVTSAPEPFVVRKP